MQLTIRTAIPSLPSGVSPSSSLGPLMLAVGRTISLVTVWNCSTSASVTSRLAESALQGRGRRQAANGTHV